ncbi:MAG: hypothetical protein GX567_08810, partial [Clostridia bacterium]|nr:hypothetical protein [Clostridia bacterium]
MRKQRISVGLLTIAACLLFVQQVYAAGSVSATASTETIAVSEQVSVTIKAENPQGAAEKPEITVEYDPKVLQFDSCDKNCGGGGGGLLTLNDTEAVITFTGIADGTANVKVSAILDGDGANVPTGAATITVGAGGTASDAAMPVSADGITDTGIADGLIAIGDNSKML